MGEGFFFGVGLDNSSKDSNRKMSNQGPLQFAKHLTHPLLTQSANGDSRGNTQEHPSVIIEFENGVHAVNDDDHL